MYMCMCVCIYIYIYIYIHIQYIYIRYITFQHRSFDTGKFNDTSIYILLHYIIITINSKVMNKGKHQNKIALFLEVSDDFFFTLFIL